MSSLASIDLRHDEWGLDVTLAGSQKGLMLPPGLSFNAISAKALAASGAARLPKSYWAWEPMLTFNASGFFPYTPSTNLLYGLREALAMLREEGLPQVFARHRRLAARDADGRTSVGSARLSASGPMSTARVVTTVMMPEGHDADALRALVADALPTCRWAPASAG